MAMTPLPDPPARKGWLESLLGLAAEVHPGEAVTVFMMFSYSFLAMAAWNTIRPITRSKFITSLGADNLPYVLLAAGFIIGILMAGYTWLIAKLPRRWGLPIVQVGVRSCQSRTVTSFATRYPAITSCARRRGTCRQRLPITNASSPS